MPKVLVVAPRFAPSNAADSHRVRMLLPYLCQHGWESEVLAVHQDSVACPVDTWLLEGLEDSAKVHRVRGLGLKWSKIPGFGNLSIRAFRALRRSGLKILRNGQFDLVYFSTTEMPLLHLGPYWKRKYGIPFIVDLQDPWYSTYYKDNHVAPPGGRLKYACMNWLARFQEPRVLRQAIGLTAVSDAYPAELRSRYPGLELPSTTLPFPGEPAERQRLPRGQAPLIPSAPGTQNWVYVGRGGEDMRKAVRIILGGLSRWGNTSVRVWFIGTSYAALGEGSKSLAAAAEDFGLEDRVVESPDRVPYAEVLRILQQADALIVPGSDDPQYTASKIYPYLLANKPLLCVFHESSSVTSLIERVKGGTVLSFDSKSQDRGLMERLAVLLIENEGIPHIPLDEEAFRPHTAEAQAEELTRFFERCLAKSRSHSTR